ncbi:ATP-binding protein [Roseateles oligotrophus]|nr:ATP-binding protein [Roseateles oligotrophus]
MLPADFVAAIAAVSAPTLVHAGTEVLFANAAMQRLLGYDLPALQAMRFDAWATPESRQALHHYGLRCLSESDELPAAEAAAQTASGAVRYLELNARKVCFEGSALVVMTCQDLSDIRHVQTSLLDLSRVLHQIIENNPVATFVIDAEHRVTQWNVACATLTGLDATDLTLGLREAWQAFYPERQPLLADLLVDGLLSGDGGQGSRPYRPSALIRNAYEAEEFFPAVGEGGRWLYLTAAPLTDGQGKVVGAIETLQDVTARRLAEEEIKRHRNELEATVAQRSAELLNMHQELGAFLENASVGIISTAKGHITFSNKKFAEMFEFGEQSPVGRSTRELFRDDAAFEGLGRVAYPVLSQGQSLMHEMEMRTQQSGCLWVQMIAYVADINNPTAGTWWLLQDRSEVRRVQAELQQNFERIQETNAQLEDAQNQLLQSEKMASIGQLAAGVAHEINNPIGFVSSNLGTLRRYVEGMLKLLQSYERAGLEPPAPALREEIRRQREELDMDFLAEDLPLLLSESDDGLVRVKKIVQDLKDFSRVDQADWQDADINAGLDSTLNVVMNEVKYKAEVRKDYAALPLVRCLAAQLNQVFMNLIVNAAHAIPERGLITLSTRHADDWVCVSVRDTGSGMSPEVARRIFEPFFTTKPVGKGTGLGLSLSFSIVKKHGGRIELESEPGQGTEFKVWIPVKGPQQPPDEQSAG